MCKQLFCSVNTISVSCLSVLRQRSSLTVQTVTVTVEINMYLIWLWLRGVQGCSVIFRDKNEKRKRNSSQRS